MPVVKLSEVPAIASMTADSAATLVMRKAIGSKTKDPNFLMPASTESVSITYIQHWGHHRRITCDDSDRVMFVVEGQAIAKVGDDKPALVDTHDFILIPRGVPYEFAGDFTYLVVNAPAFRDGSDLRDDDYDGPPVRKGAAGR